MLRNWLKSPPALVTYLRPCEKEGTPAEKDIWPKTAVETDVRSEADIDCFVHLEAHGGGEAGNLHLYLVRIGVRSGHRHADDTS